MLRISILFLSWLVAFHAGAQATAEHQDRATPVEDNYNLIDRSLGLKGYDPVSYFEQGRALFGERSITATYGGVTYRFSSTANRDLFLEDPTLYEPTYGGWCAWAMAQGSYADINPELFTRNGNRMHFFISRRTKARFDARLQFHEANADDFWKSESGENPRL